VAVTSLTRLYRGWQATLGAGVGTARVPAPCHLDVLLGDTDALVTVHDASSHAMAWLGAAAGVPTVPVGVESFGESGRIDELYAAHQLDAGHLVTAALAALDRAQRGPAML